MTAQPSDRIIVAIDLGTTYSGVAFTYGPNPDKPDDISIVKEWPGSNNRTSDKVPTEFRYTTIITDSPPSTISRKRKAPGIAASSKATKAKNSESIQWGYELKPGQPRLRYLKLILDPHQQFPLYAPKADLLAQLVKYGKTPTEAISDYLCILHSHAQEALCKRYGRHMVSSTKIDYVITVPAVWSDTAKDATLKAAIQAGIDNDLYMVSEPEAAATYAIKSLENTTLQVGDNFIVCDAGGGTVDLISYEIKSLLPLQLEESVPGRGALCGGAFLNMRFENLIKKQMTHAAFKRLRDRKPKAWPAAQNHFEDYLKRNFEGTPSRHESGHETYDILLPGADDDAAADIDSGYITISHSDVAKIFQPIIDRIFRLIEEQRHKLAASGRIAKGVVLVGGFGQSKHLRNMIERRFKHKEVKIIQPKNAWTAVVRGAVLGGLDGGKLVLSRKARRHYGVRCVSKYDATIHRLEDKYWNEFEEMFYSRNLINWHVRMGQTLTSGEPILLPFNFSDAERTSNTKLKIIVSDEEEAPPVFSCDEKTRVLCDLEADLRSVPIDCWKTCYTSTGRRFYRLEHEIGMTVESGRMIFDLRVNGIVYGQVKADFE